MNLNKEFLCVFTPKQRSAYGYRRRFLVSPYRLRLYVGRHNANTAIERALNSVADKTTVRFRKYGKIDFYVK